MMVRFVCGSCGQKFKAAEEYAGQASQCPACGTMVQIPVPEPASAAPAPAPDVLEAKQDIIRFKPVFKKSEPAPPQKADAPEHGIPVIDSTPAPEAPKLTMRLRASPPLNDNAPPAIVESEAPPQFNVPASGIKMPAAIKAPAAGLIKPSAAAPKQAFPVGFTPVTPKLPPGLRLVEDDES